MCGSTREALRGLVRRRHGRLHWRDELPDQQEKIAVAMVDALRSNGAISKAIRVDFTKPKDDPMLWVSDAVAGIVSLARRGRRMELRRALGKGVDEINIDL
jgi:hypothetical protein